jgi:aminopeptidase N
MQAVSRLLDHIIPTHYTINLDIDRIGRKFHGTTELRATSVDGQLVVHAHGLAIEHVTVDGKPASFQLEKDDELAIMYNDTVAGEHTITIDYTGTITDSLHGLYPCYFTHDGEKKELLVTQFESHYAREVFPCVDEPAAKATFDVSVTTETSITVLGNMPVKTQDEVDGRLVTRFETTPRMSTYLVALVTGELQAKRATTKNGIEVNVWATPAQKSSSLEFALKEAVDSIEFFDEYFGVPYPLPKADHVAVPDFSAGAMENWGLITYRETALVIEKSHSSLAARQYVSSVIAHELSHQWFGNLVTMKWWNNLWLNESFASIMEVIAPNHLHPQWNAWLDFDTGSAIMALRRDSIDGVQPVQTDVLHPDEIQSIFDGAIVYSKGARLLRMMHGYIGEDAFRAGLKQYFTEFAYHNTDQHDLWRALEAASGKPVDELMSAWISQPGYPVISASLVDNKLTLTQEQFFVGPHASSHRQWPIPLGASHAEIPELMNEQTVTFPYTDSWLQLNSDNSAHFITRYSDDLFARLLDRLRAGELSVAQRLQLLNEQVLLSRGGLVSPARLVDTLKAYQAEDQDPVWDVMSMAINELKKYIENDTTAEQALRTLAGTLARKQYERLGWEPRAEEPENDQKLRSRIISEMIYSEDHAVVDEAIRRSRAMPFEQLDPELRGLLVSVDVRYGDNSHLVEELMELYRHTASPDIREDIRGAITCTRNHTSITYLLGLLTDKSTIRPQDATHWYIYLLSNRSAREHTWKWLRQQWPWIEETFGTDKSYDYYPRYAGQMLMTRQQLDEYREFFTPMLSNVALTRVIEMGITDLEGRVELIETNQVAVCNRLKQV